MPSDAVEIVVETDRSVVEKSIVSKGQLLFSFRTLPLWVFILDWFI